MKGRNLHRRIQMLFLQLSDNGFYGLHDAVYQIVMRSEKSVERNGWRNICRRQLMRAAD